MATRTATFNANTSITACPKCGNNTKFVIHSEQVCEDGCEVWASCHCGFDPSTGKGERLESVMGEFSNDNIYTAVHIWNGLIEPTQPPKPPSENA